MTRKQQILSVTRDAKRAGVTSLSFGVDAETATVIAQMQGAVSKTFVYEAARPYAIDMASLEIDGLYIRAQWPDRPATDVEIDRLNVERAKTLPRAASIVKTEAA